MGTPKTGINVFAATTPGKWAAPPAAAIKTSVPRSSADFKYSNELRGYGVLIRHALREEY